MERPKLDALYQIQIVLCECITYYVQLDDTENTNSTRFFWAHRQTHVVPP
jgi:hypothetical protein